MVQSLNSSVRWRAAWCVQGGRRGRGQAGQGHSTSQKGFKAQQAEVQRLRGVLKKQEQASAELAAKLDHTQSCLETRRRHLEEEEVTACTLCTPAVTNPFAPLPPQACQLQVRGWRSRAGVMVQVDLEEVEEELRKEKKGVALLLERNRSLMQQYEGQFERAAQAQQQATQQALHAQKQLRQAQRQLQKE